MKRHKENRTFKIKQNIWEDEKTSLRSILRPAEYLSHLGVKPFWTLYSNYTLIFFITSLHQFQSGEVKDTTRRVFSSIAK